MLCGQKDSEPDEGKDMTDLTLADDFEKVYPGGCRPGLSAGAKEKDGRVMLVCKAIWEQSAVSEDVVK
jgi:hypothetical protein